MKQKQCDSNATDRSVLQGQPTLEQTKRIRWKKEEKKEWKTLSHVT